VKSGDLVVLTSDGFADNLFPNQLVQLAEEHYKKNTLSKLSKELTRIATKRASIKSGDSPFAAKAR
jgi:serine/threonine protein phosphatase PrpC